MVYESAVAREFSLAMQQNPGLAVKRFKPRPTCTASPISVEVWTEYVDQHFGKNPDVVGPLIK
jgi:hypothetical protein